MRYVVMRHETELGMTFIVMDTQTNLPVAEPFYSIVYADNLAFELNSRRVVK